MRAAPLNYSCSNARLPYDLPANCCDRPDTFVSEFTFKEHVFDPGSSLRIS